MFAAATVGMAGAMSGSLPAVAQPPSVVHANIDYEASGYVTPAGMVPPSMYYGEVMPVGFMGGHADGCAGCASCADPGYGLYESCDSSSCGGCDGCDGQGGCSDGGCLGGCFGSGGLLGKMCGGGLGHACRFCRGSGCCACLMLAPKSLYQALHLLRPYPEATLCSLRWYDLSAEGLFLSHSSGGVGGAITSQGPAGNIVLSLGDADSGGDLEGGVRISGAVICGPGGNLEATYMGGHEWNSAAAAFPEVAGTPTLFSFISEFGTNPPNGFDDTDRSLVQSVAADSSFHNVELNYRRRTMGPYCRFQGSWLVGLRYLRFDNDLLYATRGANDNTVNANLPRFFASNDSLENDLFGAQAGFDLWWNMVPGVNLGFGLKGAWVQNDTDRQTVLTANSLNVGAPGVRVLHDGEQEGTVIGDLEATIIYRLSHSWSFRSSYHAIAADDIAFGIADQQTIRDFVTGNPITAPDYQFHSLVLQGFSVGAEYIW
jgi:hypothetical protein